MPQNMNMDKLPSAAGPEGMKGGTNQNNHTLKQTNQNNHTFKQTNQN